MLSLGEHAARVADPERLLMVPSGLVAQAAASDLWRCRDHRTARDFCCTFATALLCEDSSPSAEARVAQKITVTLEDDLDGGPADETVRFGLGGTEYEIDLSTKNATAFRKQLAPFIEHARKTGRGQRRRPGQTASSREHSAGIRAWAKEQGITVSDRGRIPASVAEQYDAATKGR
jgi:hypothetical protein